MTQESRIMARRPSAAVPAEPMGEHCPAEPPSVIPRDLVDSVVFRVERAVRWANWDLAHRIVMDAKRAADETAEVDLLPLDQRPVECLYDLAGLPLPWCRALACCKPGRRPPVLVRDVVRYGELRLSTHELFGARGARFVHACIAVARRQITRAMMGYLQWTTTTTEVVCFDENQTGPPTRNTRLVGRRAAQNHTSVVLTAWPAHTVTVADTRTPGCIG